MQNLGHLAMEILFLFKFKNDEIVQKSYNEKNTSGGHNLGLR